MGAPSTINLSNTAVYTLITALTAILTKHAAFSMKVASTASVKGGTSQVSTHPRGTCEISPPVFPDLLLA